MTHRTGHDGITEILESRQFPGMVVRTPVRSAVIRDATGKASRVLYAGQEDTGTIDKDIRKLAEEDGLDLATARLDVTLEKGQGLGPDGDIRKDRLPPPPKRSRGRALTPEEKERSLPAGVQPV